MLYDGYFQESEEHRLNLANPDHFGRAFSEEEETIHLVRLHHIPIIPLHHLIKRIKFHPKHKVGLRDFGLDWLVGLQLDMVLVQGAALLRLHRSDMGQVLAQRMPHQGRVVGLEGVVRASIVIQVQGEGIEMTMEVLEECILAQDLAEQGVDSWTRVVDEKFAQLRSMIRGL